MLKIETVEQEEVDLVMLIPVEEEQVVVVLVVGETALKDDQLLLAVKPMNLQMMGKTNLPTLHVHQKNRRECMGTKER